MESDPKAKVNNKYLKLALRCIDGNEYDSDPQYKHAAVIVKGGRVLSIGTNKGKTHPKSVVTDDKGESYSLSIHAEMDAISKIKNKNQLKGATIYVARKGRAGTAGMSCPCKVCQRLINKYVFKRAVFTTDYGTGTMQFTGEDK